MPEWMSSRLPEGWTDWHIAIAAAIFGVVSAVFSLLIVGNVLARLPADYFLNHAARGSHIRHRAVRLVWILCRNTLGYFLIVLGAILSIPGVPGQGFLTILMGVMLVDFPGKFRVERWLITRRVVLAGVNKLRTGLGRPPLLIQSESPDG